MRELPAGTVTFLFTDVEGSTKLLHELGAERYGAALAEHRRAVREAVARHGGVEVDTQGDAFFMAFASPAGAVAAASDAREALESGPIRVRVGIHTGTPHVADEGYVGADVHRAARIAGCAHGGQIVVSAATASLVGSDGLRELGEHRLKDFDEPVPLYQLGDESFPPLKTISNTNLPRPASSFVGREKEIEEVASLLTDGVRLLTLTGPGGSGKTRLAIEAAAAVVPSFGAGVFWVPLASLRDPSLVTETIAQTLGAKDGLAEHVADRELLLLLDNLEQVVEAAPELASLVEACPNLRLLVTSRELLRVRGEREFQVAPLAEAEAVELFCERAQAPPEPAVHELCRALDQLPLALELAAARTSVLSPRQILERLSARLDLLTGGRDADPRQQTLRATVEWSYELLRPAERTLLARLSVFVGGSTVDAAEEVCDADVDALQSLVDKSLLRHSEERFWMLETIREYAAERLEGSGEAGAVRRRFGLYFGALATQMDAVLRAGEPEEGPLGVLESEIDNLRAAVEWGLEAGDTELVRTITAALPLFWMTRGLYAEARSSLERALELHGQEDDTTRRLLAALGSTAYAQGDYEAATAASDEAAAVATRLGGATDRLDRLEQQASDAFRSGDLDTAERLFRDALDEARAVDNGVTTSSCRLSLAAIANATERHDRAAELLGENLAFVRARGQARCEAYTLTALAGTAVLVRRSEEGGGDALLGALRALQVGDRPLTVRALELCAVSAAARGDGFRAATVLAATEAAREAMGVALNEAAAAIRTQALELLDDDVVEAAWPRGRRLDLAAAVEVAAAAGSDASE